MHALLLADMAAAASGDRVALTHAGTALTASELLGAAWAVAGRVRQERAANLAYVGPNGLAFPIALFGAAAAGVPFVPLNYRLADEQLHELLSAHAEALVVAAPGVEERLRKRGHRVVATNAFVEAARQGEEPGEVPADADGVALLLYTSGTTAAPKAAVLRHRHLTAYVISSVEFASADPEEAALVSVPPYHVAGVANLLSNLYAGRRVVYLDRFDPEAWLATVRAEGITHAMVVPTMLARICDALGDAPDSGTPTLRTLSYGGARTPASVVEEAVRLFPTTDLVNAYGLTETSSTIAVLGPEDHLAAFASADPAARARLGSAGRVLPSVEVEVRGPDGAALGPEEVGDIHVRGEQVSGEYAGQGTLTDPKGWFATRDRGWLDEDGYLFVEGRSDDTIIRGGENVAPAEIEEVLRLAPGVADCAVVGVPDDEWGQRIEAAVVAEPGASLDTEALRTFAKERLRGSKTPERVVVVGELPYTETGKLLRRVVLEELAGSGPQRSR